MKRNNSGFTMVELLVTVAVSSIVLAAAASLMLLGLRVHQTTQKEAGEQQTVRIVLSALEDLSASGKISRVEPFSDGWRLLGKTADGKSGAVLLRYNNGKLRSGGSGDQVLLDNLRGAQVILDGSLVTFSFSTAAHRYSTSVFCRTGIEGDSVGKAEAQEKLKELEKTEKDARFEFLKTLAGQYGSRGEILPENTSPYKYFSEWYIDRYEGHPGWNKNTPWCACFLSWAAEGEIEKFVALAEDVSSLRDSEEYDSEDTARAAAKDAYVKRLKDLAGGCTLTPDRTDNDVKCYKFALTYANAAVRIEAKIRMDLECPATPHLKSSITLPDGTTQDVIKYTAKVIKATHHYNTYTITHLTAEKGGTSG